MAKAYKCDICKNLFNSITKTFILPFEITEKSDLIIKVSTYKKPDLCGKGEIDICNNCLAKYLEQFVNSLKET